MSRVVAPRKPLEANDSTAAATNRLRALVAPVISLKGILHEQVLTGMPDVSNAKQPLSNKQALSNATAARSKGRNHPMPEAVIVSTARSPIGRAFKGSLKDIRADDLTVQMVRAVLGKIPELDVADIDDLVLGCGQPGGESGFNLDHVPGTTINRYCSSSLQSSRMAMHAIRAGEGDVFISAGVETVSRYTKGNNDGLP